MEIKQTLDRKYVTIAYNKEEKEHLRTPLRHLKDEYKQVEHKENKFYKFQLIKTITK